MQPNENAFIYTDGVDYTKTTKDSIWGTEEKSTSDLIDKLKITGKWLNLCAGDGRFNNRLLNKADEVTAVDIDEGALEKLVSTTPKQLKSKLKTEKINVVEPFLFDNNTFDGIFCVGTLHLFPKPIFKEIFNEMDRVLKPGGLIIIDFAADIKRAYHDGSLWTVKNEPNYTIDEAVTFLEDVFKSYKIKFIIDKSGPEEVILSDKKYDFSCNFVLLNGAKHRV